MNTPITDSLSTFLVTQFPATLGNHELHMKLSHIEDMERDVANLKLENSDLKDEIAQLDTSLWERNQKDGL